MEKVYNVEVDCAVCAGKCEEAIKKVEGVKSCSINFLMQNITLEFEGDEKEILKKALKVARKIEPDFDIEL